MVTICQIDPDTLAWTGATDVIENDADVPAGWVASAPPELEVGGVATWLGGGLWDIVNPPAPPVLITICRLDAETGAFAGETAQIAEGGPCPPGWVRAEPPVCEEGECGIWAGDGWSVQPTPEPPFAPARAAKRAEVDAVYLAHNTANFPWDFGDLEALDDLDVSMGPAGIRSLQIRDIEDKTNWTAVHTAATAAVLGGHPGVVVPIKCDDNVWIQTTAMDVLTVLTAGREGDIALLARQSANLARYGRLKKLVEDAVDQAELDAIAVSADWPSEV